MSEADSQTAATQLLNALATRPDDSDLQQQAFIATLIAGRSEAVQLAHALPDSQAAQLLLGQTEVRAGHWQAAEERFQSLPRQGLTQLLQPLLVAWAQQGDGRTDAALATLHPYLEGQRFRGVYALHAAMIVDQAGRTADATKLYHQAQVEFGQTNLRLAQVLASAQARHGHPAEAQRTLAGIATEAPEMAIALPALMAASAAPAVPRPVDGIAEAYLALAATLRSQDAGEFAMLVLRLALDLRPDFTPARLLAADILDGQRHLENALQMLAPVANDDPLIAVVRLQRATLVERLGHTDEAMHALQRLARDYPDSPIPAMREGDMLRSKQRFADAIGAYDRAISRLKTPTAHDWLAYYDRGICYERSHQWPKAEADFKHALSLSPDQPFVLNYLGYSWADMGQNLTQARAMIEKAAQRRPNDGAIVDSLGWVMLRQGNVTEAVRTLERAVELDPEDASINGHLGDAYWAAGRKLEATYQWRRALIFNPEPEDAAKLEAKLQNGRTATVVGGQ
ncbi:MAG TPA: tetratricopeptide repeat protein [Acetobacteraceae bacterium]|nr:tetratricopeptide repeat protein [Acetobacteraceae bacterium]